jgi:hypothetical protein
VNWLTRIFRRIKKSSPNESLDELVASYESKHARVREAGSVDGKHYTNYPDQIRQLKREKRHVEAIKLLLKLVYATEQESKVAGWGVAPWYYEQLAILYRKEKDYDKEVAILERYESQTKAPGAKPQKLALRLVKARELAADSTP